MDSSSVNSTDFDNDIVKNLNFNHMSWSDLKNFIYIFMKQKKLSNINRKLKNKRDFTCEEYLLIFFKSKYGVSNIVKNKLVLLIDRVKHFCDYKINAKIFLKVILKDSKKRS